MTNAPHQPALPGMADTIGTPTGTPPGTPAGTPPGTPALRLQTQTPFDMAPSVTMPGEHPAHRPAEIDALTRQRVCLRSRRYWLWLPEDTEPGGLEALEAWQALARVCGERLTVKVTNKQTGGRIATGEDLTTFDVAQLPEGFDYRVQIQTDRGEWGPQLNITRRTQGQQHTQPTQPANPYAELMRIQQDAEAKAEARFIRMMEIMRPAAPAGNMTELLTSLEALDRLRGGGAAKAANPLEAITSTIDIAKKLGMTTKAGTVPGPTTAETIKDMLPGITAALATIAKAFKPADQPEQPQPAPHAAYQQAAPEVIDHTPAQARPVASTARPPAPPRPTVFVGNELKNRPAAAEPQPSPTVFIGNELKNRPAAAASNAAEQWHGRIETVLAKSGNAGKLTPAMVAMLAEIAAAEDTQATEMQTASRIYASHIVTLPADELAHVAEFIEQTQDIGGKIIIATMCAELERDVEHFLEVCGCLQAIAFPEQIKEDEQPDDEQDEPEQPAAQPGTTTPAQEPRK
jgi:hypothetical protein